MTNDMNRDLAPLMARLLAVARRYTRREDETEDLLQDALCEALASGRSDLTDPANTRWLVGVLRNKAAAVARSSARRHAREALYADTQAHSSGPIWKDPLAVDELPPALRIVARLTLLGHNRKEIAHVLGISDAALRQRISALRRCLVKAEAAAPTEFIGLEMPLAYGEIRRALKTPVCHTDARLGSHDPDGHLFVIHNSGETSQNRKLRQQ